jgi:hypothetical protein
MMAFSASFLVVSLESVSGAKPRSGIPEKRMMPGAILIRYRAVRLPGE